MGAREREVLVLKDISFRKEDALAVAVLHRHQLFYSLISIIDRGNF